MKIVVRPMEALAAAKDPTKFEWYRIVEGTVKIDTPKAEIELGKNEKFGIKFSRGAYFLMDADDTSQQFRITERDLKRLMKKAKGFGGKIDGVKVTKGKEGKAETAKPEKATKPKVIRPKKVEPEPPEEEEDLPVEDFEDEEEDVEEDEFDIDDALREQEEFDREIESEIDEDAQMDEEEFGIPNIRTSRARLTKRRAWVKDQEEEESEAEETPVKREPLIIPTKAPEIPKPVSVKIPKAPRPDSKTLSGRLDPETRKLYTALQSLAHVLESKEPSFSTKSRIVLKWLHAMVSPASSIEEEFAVQFANAKKWPDESKFLTFLDEATRFASNRTVSNALHRIRKNVSTVVTTFAKSQFIRSAWAANVRKTVSDIERMFLELGFVHQAGNLVREIPDADDSSYLSPNVQLNTTKMDVDVTFSKLIPDGREWQSKTLKTVAFPVGKVRKSDVSKAISDLEKKK